MPSRAFNLSGGYIILAFLTNCVWKINAKKNFENDFPLNEFTGRNLTDDYDQRLNVSSLLEFAVATNESTNEIDSYASRMKFYSIMAYCITEVFLSATLGLFVISKVKAMTNRPIFICHLVCLLGAYLMLILSRVIHLRAGTLSCFMIGLVKQYTFTASFSWLLILSFSNWRRFRNLNSLVEAEPSFKTRTFLLQCCFGWGLPTVTCAASFTIDWSHPDKDTGACSLHDFYKFLPIYFVPLGFILALITIFSLMTINNIRRMGEDVAGANPKIHKATFRMCLKLILIMGLEQMICYTTKMVALNIGGNRMAWDILNLLNSLQGIYIFIIYLRQMRPIKNAINLWIQKLKNKKAEQEVTKP